MLSYIFPQLDIMTFHCYVPHAVSITICPPNDIDDDYDDDDDDDTSNSTLFIVLFVLALMVNILLAIIIIYLIVRLKKITTYSLRQ